MKIDEINRLNPYEYMDEELDSFRKFLVNEFSKYKVKNNLRLTKEMFGRLKKRCDKMFLRIARHYNREQGGSFDYDKDWLFDFLLEFDPITGYQFSNEWERKMYRCYEEVESAKEVKKSLSKIIKKQMKLINDQVTQKAIETADRGRMDAYKERKVSRFRWHTQRDERVCPECYPRDMKIYDADKLPKKHYFCRCWLEAV